MTRDMTKKQFDEALAERGFVAHGFLGYYRLPDAPNVSVSIRNGGKKRRDQLAYLIRENEAHRVENDEFERRRAAIGAGP